MTLRPLLAHPAWRMAAAASLILFAASAARHAMLQSNAWDLGIFDQGIWLLSQGATTVETISNMHIIADHGALIHYPTALLYRLHPTVHWLFFLQALALGLGAVPVWHLARDKGLSQNQANTMALVYLLYPLILNLSLFDYHPETIAVPGFFAAVLAARRNRVGWFCLALVLILSCKEALALSVASMGLWLLLFENRRGPGLIALIGGLAWVYIDTALIMPAFDEHALPSARHLVRYAYLGETPADMLRNLVAQPGLLAAGLFTLDNLFYLVLLAAPVAWGLSPRHMAPVLAAAPALAMNLLSDVLGQKNIVFQYSVPILPFLLLWVLSSYAARNTLIRAPRAIVVWSIIAFLALAKFGYFWSIYLDNRDTWSAAHAAIALVPEDGSVFAVQHLVPHLTHRQSVHVADDTAGNIDFQRFDHILLDARHSGALSSPQAIRSLISLIEASPDYTATLARDGVFLFQRSQ